MRTIVSLVIDHKKPIPELANLIAQRAYTLPGVDDARHADEFISLPVVDVMQKEAEVAK